MQGLINKITKTIIAPLPSSYSGSFRGLIKSMLRKSPEHRPSAAELLRHPHLQPYLLQVNLKSSPTHDSLPAPHPVSNHIKKIRFPDDGHYSARKEEKRHSLGNEKILKQNQPATERDSIGSTRSIKDYPGYRNRRTKDLSVGSSQVGESGVTKVINSEPNVLKTPAYTPHKTFTTPKKQLDPSKGTHTGPNCKLQPSSTPVPRLARTNRGASLPFPAFETPSNRNSSVPRGMLSPDVSVNAPRIDRIAKFPLASSEDQLFSVRRIASAHGSSSSPTPRYGDLSITKDKCTVQIFRAEGDNGSDTSGRNASSRGSSDSRRRFDTSSYQQRAAALEGLLEFSAHLLQQERFDELGVLLRPFGPEKASPRETAIWLTKSFKETAV